LMDIEKYSSHNDCGNDKIVDCQD